MENIKKIKFELIQMEKNYQTNKSIFVKDRTIFIIGRSKELGKKIFFVNDFYPRFKVEKGENIKYILPLVYFTCCAGSYFLFYGRGIDRN